MTEKEQAQRIANQWLDMRMNSLVQMAPGDPDCDACVLARQYMRALDTIHQLQDLCQRLHNGDILSENMMQAAISAKWPQSVS